MPSTISRAESRTLPARSLRRAAVSLQIATIALVAAGGALADDGTRTVSGLDGKEVTIKDPVERIVTIPMPSASMFISVDGKADRLVGMHERSKEALLEGVLGDYFPDAKAIASDITKEGFVPNIENIMRLYPDVVVQWETMPKTFESMEGAGLNVAAFVRYNNEELAYRNLRLVASILGQEEKQEELIEWRKGMEAAVRKKAAPIPDEEKKSVAWILYHKKGLQVAGGNSYVDFIFETGGGVLAGDDIDGWPKIDMEQLLAWDPDIIVIGNFDPLVPADIYNDPMFSALKAVKNKRVYKMPLGGYRWGPANQESPLAWMWAYNILNPDRDPFDLRQEIKDQYAFIYGSAPTEDQIDTVLHLDLNKDSADYDQFVR